MIRDIPDLEFRTLVDQRLAAEGPIEAHIMEDRDLFVTETLPGERTKMAQASTSDATNLFVARDIVRGWIAADLKEGV